ncbi:unnamed protein product [Gongylonema pulchrum]|uniref:V-SNARE coiled-coil homology domain-containing protein n=1 Tax=Gongylonema pulchrum TaxID=637853 RepID=A0A183E8R1_9BILA|nr:unnamed protein product [Gongylonema pulchrum]
MAASFYLSFGRRPGQHGNSVYLPTDEEGFSRRGDIPPKSMGLNKGGDKGNETEEYIESNYMVAALNNNHNLVAGAREEAKPRNIKMGKVDGGVASLTDQFAADMGKVDGGVASLTDQFAADVSTKCSSFVSNCA